MIPITVSDVNRPGHGAYGLHRRTSCPSASRSWARPSSSTSHAVGRRVGARRSTGCSSSRPAADHGRAKGSRCRRTCSSAPNERHSPGPAHAAVARRRSSTRSRRTSTTMFAPQTTVHGSLVDVYGVGLLFTGKSGIGKSEMRARPRRARPPARRRRRGHRHAPPRRLPDRHRRTSSSGTTWRSAASASSTCRRSSASAPSACRSGSRCSVDLQEWGAQADYDRIGLDEHDDAASSASRSRSSGADHSGQEHHRDRRGRGAQPLLKAHGFHPAEQLNASLLESMKKKLPRRPGALRPADGLD